MGFKRIFFKIRDGEMGNGTVAQRWPCTMRRIEPFWRITHATASYFNVGNPI